MPALLSAIRPERDMPLTPHPPCREQPTPELRQSPVGRVTHPAPAPPCPAHPPTPQDHAIRLWSSRSRQCVAILKGDGAHTNEVLSVVRAAAVRLQPSC